MKLYYKLDENNNVVACTVDECERGLNRIATDPNAPERVGQTTVGDLWISTVFLSINHNFHKEGPPIIFETMIRNQKEDEWLNYQERYCTYEQALAGHNEAVEWVKNGCKENESE